MCTQIKVTGYKTLLVYLPCAIIPYKTSSTLDRPEGFVNRIVYGITGEIDRTPYGDICDVGSKPWLVSQAFNGPENENECKNENDSENIFKNRKKNEIKGGGDSEAGGHGISGDYPEDKFHIKLPSNVNQYTGVPMDENNDNMHDNNDIINDNRNDKRIEIEKKDNDYYPEDSFHQKDASSTYLISQREERIKDKWAKHEK
jgi:hypothetical protein